MSDHPHTSINGPASLLTTIISTFLTWISMKDAQVAVTIIASLFAAGSGFMAIRYYILASEEKKMIIAEKKALLLEKEALKNQNDAHTTRRSPENPAG